MKKRKFVLTQTGEEVKIGDKIAYVSELKHSFGVLKSYQEYLLTEDNIDSFIKKGIIKVAELTPEEKHICDLGYLIDGIAKASGKSGSEVADLLDALNNAGYKKAVFDILLQEASNKLREKDIKKFNNAEEYFSIRIKDGKVGKVLAKTNYIPLFKSKEDAEVARRLLKEQLTIMYGEQEDC